MPSEEHRKNMIRAYQMAGSNFLAMKLERIFREIKTDEDRILHNDMVRELGEILPNPTGFLGTLATTINLKQIAKKNYLKAIANIILESVYMKGKPDAKESR